MKLAFTLIAFLSFSVFAQKDKVTISAPLMNQIYAQCVNVFKINSNNRGSKKYILECNGCDTIFKIKSTFNEWAISADSVKTITLIVKNKRNKVLNQTEFKVVYPPKPNIFIDALKSQNIIRSLPQKLYLKLDQSIPLFMQFVIIKWEIKIDDKTFKGNGNIITNEVRNYLNEKKKGILSLKIDYKDVYGSNSIKDLIEFDLS